ncbi:MAG: branched-chain amino acid ABC transporter substrate-binding protein, partial [Proteobacteria bacterium]|nr:branched-chain amino acid ABC transporter substrate-binding protein [Pseudomonadota bacterium]
TIVCPITFGPDGERANPTVDTIQFRGLVDKNVDQFRQTGKQVILYPQQFKSGEVQPFSSK